MEFGPKLLASTSMKLTAVAPCLLPRGPGFCAAKLSQMYDSFQCLFVCIKVNVCVDLIKNQDEIGALKDMNQKLNTA